MFVQTFMFGAILPTGLVVLGFIADFLLNLARGRLAGNRPVPRSPWSSVLVIAFLGIPLGIFLQDSFFLQPLSRISVLYFTLPCLGLLAAVAVFFGIREHRIPAALRGWILLLAACIPAIALSYGLGTTLHHWQIHAARAYIESALPVLDSIKMKTGTYPVSLPVAILGSPPKLLRNTGYTSNGREFHFYYSDPWDLFGEGDQMDSTLRRWTHDSPLD